VQLDDFSHVTAQRYAAHEYWSDLEAARQREWTWNQKRLRLLLRYIRGIEEAKVLDYGSGHGGFLEAGAGVLGHLTGFDLSRTACEAHWAAGWRAVHDLSEAPDDIEVVLLFHVLEHLPEPWEHLAELRRRFARAGTFVIEVPNLCEALHALFENSAYRHNQFGAEHLYYFTAQTLRMVVEAAGLRVAVEAQYQRYTLANHFGWLNDGTGGGQERYAAFNDERLNEEYERVLAGDGLGDSLFMICRPGSDGAGEGSRADGGARDRPVTEETREGA
jgi:2-polyprenyl-3-methyl-5-hydroxy-6-metoxy-1,4-benzoquinol methylase